MRTWHLYLIRRQSRPATIRAYTTGAAVPRKWRAKYLGPLPCPTRLMAERLAAVLGWKTTGRLPGITQ